MAAIQAFEIGFKFGKSRFQVNHFAHRSRPPFYLRWKIVVTKFQAGQKRAKILQNNGLRAGVLSPSVVSRWRVAWNEKHIGKIDVLITNARLEWANAIFSTQNDMTASPLCDVLYRRSLTAASPHLNPFEARAWSEWLAAHNKALPTRNGQRKSAAAQGQCGNEVSGHCFSVNNAITRAISHGFAISLQSCST